VGGWNWTGCRALVGHCGAMGALDWGGAMAAAAIDGGQWGGGGPVRE
jgi:hypothetical protein